jgi:hypothetical protein
MNIKEIKWESVNLVYLSSNKEKFLALVKKDYKLSGSIECGERLG